MSYNPNHLVPPDNPNAIWCDYCGEQIYTDDYESFDEPVFLLNGIILHPECLEDYSKGLQRTIETLEKKIGEMVERGLS